MTVVMFPRAARHGSWQPIELQQFVSMSSDAIAMGEASTWYVGATERNDPQFFLIGPPPEHDCIIAISRLGRLYVIEDGAGHVLFESNNPTLLAEQAVAALRRRKMAIVARVAVAWGALREFCEEKTEALGEQIELIAHFAPQLAPLV
jgi:hypothetical protein